MADYQRISKSVLHIGGDDPKFDGLGAMVQACSPRMWRCTPFDVYFQAFRILFFSLCYAFIRLIQFHLSSEIHKNSLFKDLRRSIFNYYLYSY